MLNISKTKIGDQYNWNQFSALKHVESKRTRRAMIRVMKWSFFLLLIVALMPWTQNVRTTGTVTTILPEQRPQTVHSVIAGRVENWSVREGQQVKKGDTLLVISEIKDDYMDERLLERTKNQLELKKDVVNVYSDKEAAQGRQLEALQQQQVLKLEQANIKWQQAKLKVQNDSIKLSAAIVDLNTAQQRYNRMDSLYQKGLKSLMDLESRNLTLQKAKAMETEARNNYYNSQNEFLRLRIDLATIRAEYETYYAKTLSEKLTTGSNRLDAASLVNKMENMYSNYESRSGYHVITAPQNGYITKTFITGIGETIKEGQAVLSIMPDVYDLAIEIYVDPIDLPLMHVGEHVRVQFDGWPAVVFSGWPNASYGTYGGTIYAIDQYIGENGKFRLLVKPDAKDRAWPKALRFGGGVKAMILLNDVPIWYELWRQVNGFPPEYYQPKKSTNEKKK